MSQDRELVLRDSVAAALEHGVDIVGRRVFMHGDVDEQAIGLAVRGLYLLSDMNPARPIELYVSSYGGALDEAFALHDVTRTIRAPVHTVALGKCMSAAPLLVACGQTGERYTTDNTTFMLHDAHVEAEGSPAQVELDGKLARETMDRYCTLLGRYTDKPKRFWASLIRSRTDRYFTAQDALEWGLVDGIWSEKD